MKPLMRYLLQLWARTGIAPGLLHQYVDQKSSALHDKPLLKKVYGNNKILCDLRDHVQSRIYFMGAYEPIEAYLFLSLIRPDMHIVDAGANIGFYSLLAASKVSDRGHVFSFEPVPSNYEQLEANIQKSQNSRIQIIKEGLWDKEETLSFALDQTHDGNHGSFTAGKVSEATFKFDCPVNTLDSHIEKGLIPKVDLMKMDIEGSELFALKGAEETIKTHLPTLLVEINKEACEQFDYQSQQIDELLLPLGYKIFRVESLPENSGFIESTKGITQSNVFFVSPKDQSRFKTNWDYKKVKKMFASY